MVVKASLNDGHLGYAVRQNIERQKREATIING